MYHLRRDTAVEKYSEITPNEDCFDNSEHIQSWMILYFKIHYEHRHIKISCLRSLVCNKLFLYFVFSDLQGRRYFLHTSVLTAGRERAATHVEVLCCRVRGAAMPLDFLFRKQRMLLKKEEIQQQVCTFHGLERGVMKSRSMGEKAHISSLLSSPQT
jgi:hypothetical protein